LKLQTTRPSRKGQPKIRPIHPIFENPPYGIFSRIARKLSVSPSHARKVALGLHVSSRVSTALIAEASRIATRLRKMERAA